MARYRESLPQLSDDLYLMDGGIETDLIFNHGIKIREFASHTLLADAAGRQAVVSYFRGYLALACELGTGFILNSQTWKAHMHWAGDLGASEEELKAANQDSVDLIVGLRGEARMNTRPIVLNGVIGPRSDGYGSNAVIAAHEAEEYHSRQLAWLAETDVDMVTATTFTQSAEAAGVVRAARKVGLPVVVSFTVETDGWLPSGQPLCEAIDAVDRASDSGAAYFLLNCAHPDHFAHVLEDARWARRIRGIRPNASQRTHAELNDSDTLDAGNPDELGRQCRAIYEKMPWLNIFGGCCGTDLRHVAEIGGALAGLTRFSGSGSSRASRRSGQE
ncbi:MAG: homocysteine S-methyltransferase family protein [Planctomycetota bacterium]